MTWFNKLNITGLWNGGAPAPVSDTQPLPVKSDAFTATLKFEPQVGEEIRREETATDDYQGIAADNAATSAPVWKVVRFYKTLGKTTRARYRTGVAWDNRTTGW